MSADLQEYVLLSGFVERTAFLCTLIERSKGLPPATPKRQTNGDFAPSGVWHAGLSFSELIRILYMTY